MSISIIVPDGDDGILSPGSHTAKVVVDNTGNTQDLAITFDAYGAITVRSIVGLIHHSSATIFGAAGHVPHSVNFSIEVANERGTQPRLIATCPVDGVPVQRNNGYLVC